MTGRTGPRGGQAPMFLVDEEFAREVFQHSWGDHQGYLWSRIGGKYILLHRFVWSLKHGSCPAMLDHVNRVKWDNRLNNLRPATPTLNQLNRSAPCKASNLPVGVRLERRSKVRPYQAKIKIDGRKVHLGCFQTLELASAAYESARLAELLRHAGPTAQ